MEKEILARFEKFIGRKITVQEVFELAQDKWMYGTCIMDKEGKILNPMDTILIKALIKENNGIDYYKEVIEDTTLSQLSNE